MPERDVSREAHCLPMSERDVSLDVANVGRSVGTMGTLVRFLPSVGPDVVLQVLSLHGGVVTLGTLKSFPQLVSRDVLANSDQAVDRDVFILIILSMLVSAFDELEIHDSIH